MNCNSNFESIKLDFHTYFKDTILSLYTNTDDINRLAKIMAHAFYQNKVAFLPAITKENISIYEQLWINIMPFLNTSKEYKFVAESLLLSIILKKFIIQHGINFDMDLKEVIFGILTIFIKIIDYHHDVIKGEIYKKAEKIIDKYVSDNEIKKDLKVNKKNYPVALEHMIVCTKVCIIYLHMYLKKTYMGYYLKLQLIVKTLF